MFIIKIKCEHNIIFYLTNDLVKNIIRYNIMLHVIFRKQNFCLNVMSN